MGGRQTLKWNQYSWHPKTTYEKIVAFINECFDPRPGAIIRDLGLRKPIYRKIAVYSHLGRDNIEFPWERTDKAALRTAAGLS